LSHDQQNNRGQYQSNAGSKAASRQTTQPKQHSKTTQALLFVLACIAACSWQAAKAKKT
jgi:hypothetical protein